MDNFSLLIKPASADCNLRCEYCFYLKKCALYPDETKHRMSEETLEAMVRSYIGTKQEQYIFAWQGGEPTLMGADFFQKAIDFQKKYGAESNVTIANGLQTNGTLIDDGMAALFAEYKFLLGVSLDGPAEIHDRYRAKAAGGGSHENVLRGIEILKRHSVEFNILILVSQSNAGRAAEVYDYLTDKGFLFHQYIPCVEPDESGGVAPFSISGAEWGDFLCELFDRWNGRDTRRVSVRLFDSILKYLVDDVKNVCHMQDDCRRYFVVEHNGDIYPCDFFVEPELKLGNVAAGSWAEMGDSRIYEKFGARKKEWNAACDGCGWTWICAGDCLKHRLVDADTTPRSLSRLCAGWKRFYAHAMPRLKELAEEIKKERRARVLKTAAGSQKPGRNDPCPCGSGKKFKKCCG